MSEPNEQLAFLAEAGRVLGASLDLDDTFARVARLCAARLGQVCVFDLIGPPVRRVAVASADPAKEALAQELLRYAPAEGHPIFEAVSKGELMLLPQVTDQTLRSLAHDERHFELMKQFGFESVLIAPLVVRGQVLGVLSITREKPQRHSPADVQLAAQVAERAAAAVDNARLYASEHAARAAAEQLQHVTAALSGALAPQHVAHVILGQGLAAIGAAAGVVTVLSEAGTHLDMLGFVGYDDAGAQPFRRIALEAKTPVTHAFARREAQFVESKRAWRERFEKPFLERSPYHAWAALPLLIGREAIGALGVSFRDERTFPPQERAFLSSLAALCAQALHRAQLYAAERRSRAQAEEALQARDEFLSVASHELRTPLTPLLLQLGLLRNEVAATPLAAKVDLALRQTERLSRLTANLLDVARIDARSFALEPAEVELGQLVRAVTERFAEQAQRAGVALGVDTEPVQGRWDALRLEQIVTNLLSNAMKYGQGKPVRVTLRRHGERAVLTVEDDGIGIAPDAQQTLFQRFTRAVTQRQFGGLGLGLYISRQIAEAHGGTLSVQSEPGKGAKFTLELPLSDAAR